MGVLGEWRIDTPLGSKHVHFREIAEGCRFEEARAHYRKDGNRSIYDVCPLCKKSLLPKELTKLIMMISNQAGIPTAFFTSNVSNKGHQNKDWFDL